MYNSVILFGLIFLKLLAFGFIKSSYFKLIMMLELMVTKVFLVLVFVESLEPVFLYVYLVISACGAVFGLSVLVSIAQSYNRKSSSMFLN